MAFNEESAAAEQAVADRLAEAGADTVRRHSFGELPASPEPPAERPRDEAGRFTKQEEAPVEETAPEEVPAETPAEVVAEETPGEDPAVAAYLAKYGGDVNKAIQAAVSAQKKLGELGSEVGEHRKQAAEYEQVISELNTIKQQLAQPVQQPQYVDQATVDWIDQQIVENPMSAQQFAVQAAQNGQTMLYERIMDTWYQVAPRAAGQFETAVRVEQAKQELRASVPATPTDEGVQMQAALSSVLTTHPEFNQYADDLGAVIERYPGVAAGLRGGQQEKQQAIETLFALAERDTLRSIALLGNTPQETATETNVATATTSTEHPTEDPAQPSKLDQFREDFRKTAEQMRNGAFVAR